MNKKYNKEKRYVKSYNGHKYEVIGARGEGWLVIYNHHELGYTDTHLEAELLFQQVVGNGLGDKTFEELSEEDIVETK